MSLLYLLSCFLAVLTRCSTETQDKGCKTTLTSLNGTITSPTPPQKYTDREPEYTCKWNIELLETPEPRHTELQFTKFNLTGVMPDCSGGDYVELFLGCNNFKSIGKLCGQTSLPVVYSPDHCLQIVLHAYIAIADNPSSMFEAVYNQRLLSRAVSQDYFGCGKEHHVNVKHGNIFSPHWPLPYPQYVDCVWHVTTRPGLHVKLIFFDFDVRLSDPCAEADFVEVKTGDFGFNQGRSAMKSKECGTKAPFALTIEGDSVFIQFKSDAVTGNRGFMAGFVAYSVEEPGFQSHVVIMLGLVFVTLFALVGKAILQKLLEGNKLKRKSVFQRLRRHSQTTGVSPIIVSPWRESAEPERLSAASQCEKPSTEPWTKEEWSPSIDCEKSVTFETVATRDKQGSVNIVIGYNEPDITVSPLTLAGYNAKYSIVH